MNPRFEPVRIYGAITALVALAVHYMPDLPSELILAFVAAVLGVGTEATRRRTHSRAWVDAQTADES